MRASYDSIDNKLKQKMCGKVNKDITFIQLFHSTELFKIFFSLLTLQLLFWKKLVGREKIEQFIIFWQIIKYTSDVLVELNNFLSYWSKTFSFTMGYSLIVDHNGV